MDIGAEWVAILIGLGGSIVAPVAAIRYNSSKVVDVVEDLKELKKRCETKFDRITELEKKDVELITKLDSIENSLLDELKGINAKLDK